MSIEVELQKLTAALEANTAALLKAGGAPAKSETAAAETKPGKPGKPAKADTKPAKTKVTLEEVKAAIIKVRDAHGTPSAKEVISGVGKADKMDNIDAENFEAVLAKCAELLDEGTGDSDEGDGL